MKENETEEMEKMVEEIRKGWCKSCESAIVDGDNSEFLGCDIDAQNSCDKRVSANIARIGKAYAEGLPLPGEVGRCSRIGIPPSPEFEDWIQHVTEYHHSDLVIALRREEEK